MYCIIQPYLISTQPNYGLIIQRDSLQSGMNEMPGMFPFLVSGVVEKQLEHLAGANLPGRTQH